MVLNINDYMDQFCIASKIEKKVLLKGRCRENSMQRQYFSFFGNIYLKFAKTDLARALKLDHTSIIYQIRTIQGLIDINDIVTTENVSKLIPYFFNDTDDFSFAIVTQEYDRLHYKYNAMKKDNIEYKILLTQARKKITELQKQL